MHDWPHLVDERHRRREALRRFEVERDERLARARFAELVVGIVLTAAAVGVAVLWFALA